MTYEEWFAIWAVRLNEMSVTERLAIGDAIHAYDEERFAEYLSAGGGAPTTLKEPPEGWIVIPLEDYPTT